MKAMALPRPNRCDDSTAWLTAALVGAGEQHRGARLERQRRVDAGHLRQLAPARHRGRLGFGDLRHRVRLPGAGRRDLQPRERRRLRGARPRIDQQRQRVGDRRAAVAAFAERARAAEHQQAAAAAIDEVGNHLQLVAREGAGLDAAENQAAVLEQLVARLREAADQFVRILRLVAEEPHVLVVGGALQRDDLEVLVVGHGAAQELHLEARLAFEVEDALARVADVHQRLAHVVLRDELAVLRRDLELEEPRARLGGHRPDAHRARASRRSAAGPSRIR